MERFLAGGADGRILLVARGADERVVAMRERFVNEVRLTLDAHETLLVPVLVLETDVLPTHPGYYNCAPPLR